MSDGELVRQALDGRTDARDQLVQRWAARVLAFCHTQVRARQTAEDLAQEALLRAFRALGTLADPEKFGPWLRGIARRVCLDWHKSKSARLVTFGSLGGEEDLNEMLIATDSGPEQILDCREQRARLLAAVEELPDECREVVMLYYYQDVTYKDLAEQLGASTATINARLTKARALLRERMAGLRRS
jgi:RNA polymerase sigma-70 factor (ECF subfamily)